MIEASGQFPIEGRVDGKIENSQLSTLNSQLDTSVSNSRAATQLDIERLKLIDEVSRLLLELKSQFPELAQNLSKARDYISTNQENIPIKNLMNLFSEIQQNLEALENKPAPAQKLELIDTIKNLVNDVIKILQPNSEVPSENKLILALAQNDFASANTAIKNIVEQVRALHAAPQPVQVQNSKIENFRIIFNTLQELKELGIPKELQKAPLKELEAIVLQRNGIELPKEAAKNISMIFSEKPAFAAISLKIDFANTAEPVRLQITPLPATPQQLEGQTHRSAPTSAPTPAPTPAPTTPQQIVSPQPPQGITQTFEIALPKDFPLQRILANIPLPQTSLPPQVRALQATPQPVSPPPQQSEGQTHRSTPTLPQILPQSSPQVGALLATPQQSVSPPPQQPEGQTHRSAPTLPQISPQPSSQSATQPPPQVGALLVTPQLVSPPPQQPEGQTHRSAPTLPQILPQPSPQPVSPQTETQPATQTPLQVRALHATPQLVSPQKIEIAFSLYQITPKSDLDIPSQTKIQPQFILQPWTASIALPKAERDFWLKTDLPLTPQILNIREAILSSGKLPENPEIVKSFASNLHEMSLLTEHGTSVSKEQANLLWRVVQLNSQSPTPNSQLSTLNSQLLKYHPTGNYEGDLFKSLPEVVKRELSQELPSGKIWQPETMQKAVEKILEKYIEQPPPSTANLNEHTSKAHEEIRNSLQNLKEQIQWTRIDQDTRPQNDRENIFYFMHNGELQKGRVKIKDERKGSSKKQQDSSISFTIKTKAKNLGEVHADLTLSKNKLNIRMQDEVGTASNAVKEERETLAKELSDIGITLGELLYGKTPKIQHLPVAKKEKSSGELDVMA
jgi:hypothetical protein